MDTFEAILRSERAIRRRTDDEAQRSAAERAVQRSKHDLPEVSRRLARAQRTGSHSDDVYIVNGSTRRTTRLSGAWDVCRDRIDSTHRQVTSLVASVQNDVELFRSAQRSQTNKAGYVAPAMPESKASTLSLLDEISGIIPDADADDTDWGNISLAQPASMLLAEPAADSWLRMDSAQSPSLLQNQFAKNLLSRVQKRKMEEVWRCWVDFNLKSRADRRWKFNWHENPRATAVCAYPDKNYVHPPSVVLRDMGSRGPPSILSAKRVVDKAFHDVAPPRSLVSTGEIKSPDTSPLRTDMAAQTLSAPDNKILGTLAAELAELQKTNIESQRVAEQLAAESARLRSFMANMHTQATLMGPLENVGDTTGSTVIAGQAKTSIEMLDRHVAKEQDTDVDYQSTIREYHEQHLEQLRQEVLVRRERADVYAQSLVNAQALARAKVCGQAESRATNQCPRIPDVITPQNAGYFGSRRSPTDVIEETSRPRMLTRGPQHMPMMRSIVHNAFAQEHMELEAELSKQAQRHLDTARRQIQKLALSPSPSRNQHH